MSNESTRGKRLEQGQAEMRKRWAAKLEAKKKPASVKLKVAKASGVVTSSTTIVGLAEAPPKIEESQPRVYTRKSVVFESQVIGRGLFLKDKVGLLLDRLIALCESKPEYLRSEDAARYTDLMKRLKQTTLTSFGSKGKSEELVANMPIDELGHILEEWIFLLRHDSSGLLPHYALDTARFIESMVVGRSHCYPEPWEVKPMFGEQIANVRFSLNEKHFKTNFSRHFGGIVKAVVPEGVTVRWNGGERTVLVAGDTFLVSIRRCHLSESINENTWLKIDPDQESTAFNLASEFVFKGYISMKNDARLFFEVPAYWVTHEILHFGSKDAKQIDIPERWINPALIKAPAT